MKRRRGRGNSPTSYSDDTSGPTTSPEEAARKSKRSSSTTRASRLLPSEPLHMTTRRAASRAATNSTAGSVASVDSRRSSLADATNQIGGFDIDSHRPTKKARLSDRSNTTTGSRRSSIRQRKTPSQEPIESLEISGLKSQATGTPEPPRILEPGDSSSENASKEPISNGIHEAVESAAQQQLLSPFPKRRGRWPKKQAATPAESVNGSPAPGTPYHNSQQGNGTDRDASRAPKRMPGRRRAPHADASIEADLRRQLHLRLAYRSVAKALKPVLAELAHRSLTDMQNDEEAHKEVQGYERVQGQLDAYLARRLWIVENEMKIKEVYYQQSFDAQKEMLETQFINVFKNLQENYRIEGQNQLLELYRENEKEVDADATDDDDVIVRSLYGKPTPISPLRRLDKSFDSRSRFFIDTERIEKDLDARSSLQDVQREAIADEDPESELKLPEPTQVPETYATIDAEHREHATAELNLQTLTHATEAVEEEANAPKPAPLEVIPNSLATRLQALAAAIDNQPAQASTEVEQLPPAPEEYQQILSPQEVQAMPTPQSIPRQQEFQQPPGISYAPIAAPQLVGTMAPPYSTIPGPRASIEYAGPSNLEPQVKDSNSASFIHYSMPNKSYKRKHSRDSSASSSKATFSPMARLDEGVPTALATQNEYPFAPAESRPLLEMTNLSAQNGEAVAHDLIKLEEQPPRRTPSRNDHSSPPASKRSLWTSVAERQNQKVDRRGSDTAIRPNAHDATAIDSRPPSRAESNAGQSIKSEQSTQAQVQHQRNLSIPGRLLTPPAYLTRRSHSPIVPGRRATLDHPGPILTNFGPPTNSSQSGSQSAIEPLQGPRSPHPVPGSWQGPRRRTPPNYQQHHGRYPPLAPNPSIPGQAQYPPQHQYPGPPPPAQTVPYQGPPQSNSSALMYPPPPPPQYSGQPYAPPMQYQGPPPPPGYALPSPYSNQPPHSQGPGYAPYSAPATHQTPYAPAVSTSPAGPHASVASPPSQYSSAVPLSSAVSSPYAPPYPAGPPGPPQQPYAYPPPPDYSHGQHPPPPPPNQQGHARQQSSGSWSRQG